MLKGQHHTEESKSKLFEINIKEIKWNVDKSGCYICTSHKPNCPDGYPRLSRGGKRIFVDRFLWEQKHGPIPKGLCLCHACDNTKCINLKHLFLATHQDNIKDMVMKNRNHFGVECHSNKLRESQVIEIFNSKRNNYQLGREYGIDASTVWRIKHKEKWKRLLQRID